MTAAVAVAMMASCTDDLQLGNNRLLDSDADLVGVINDNRPDFTRMGMYEGTVAPWDEGTCDWGLVWTQGDQVRVFTLEQLTYNYYQLKDGSANAPKGEFLKKNAESKLVGDNKYAITDAQFVYGVSATKDGEARLTYTIPYRWKAGYGKNAAGTADVVNVKKFPAPYWGLAKETGSGEDVKLDVGFDPMTAFLRIEMDKLPAGTKYIVLTTHGDPYAIANEGAGTPAAPVVGDPDAFSIADGDKVSPDFIAKVNGKTDLNSDWVALANGGLITNINNGKAEPISGTFNTLLKTGAQLAPDDGIKEDGSEAEDGFSRLVTRDEIIIELDLAHSPKIFYVPVIANTYKNLHVVAAKAVSRYAYRYVGTLLHTFKDFEFENGGYYFLTKNLVNLGEVSTVELNAAIKAVNTRADRNSVLNVDNLINITKPTTNDQWTALVNKINNMLGTTYTKADIEGFAWDRIKVQGSGSLEINLKKITETPGVANGTSSLRSDITNYGASGKTLFVTDDVTADKAIEATNKVTIRLPHQISDGPTSNPTTDADYELKVNLPTYNAELGSIDGKNLKNLVVLAQISKTKCVTGHNLKNNDGTDILDKKDAAFNLVTGVEDLNILAASEGDVFINNIAENLADQLEVNNALNIQTLKDIDVRVDNALVKQIAVLEREPQGEVYIHSTGSSAFQLVNPITSVGADYSSTVSDAIPDDVTMHSYWTGAALNAEFAGIAAYDCGRVYTTAQLASMGEKIGGSGTAVYYIPAELVNDMWLGARKYRWVGAAATVENFSFDGNNVPLRKMNMTSSLDDAVGSKKVYVDDPHMCCTTCGWKPAVYGTINGAAATALKSIGLIRSYINTGSSANIQEANVSDVEFIETTAGVNCIGSIVGKVEAKGLTLNYNTVTNPKITVSGDSIGGMAGKVKLSGALVVTNNLVSEDGQETTCQITSTKNFVGGLIGCAEGATTADFLANAVKLNGAIQAGKAYAGGLAGNLAATDVVTFGGMLNQKPANDIVKVTKIMAKDGSYAGGFAGKVATTKANDPAVLVNWAEVTVSDSISSSLYYAGGLFGQAQSGGKNGEIRLKTAAIKAGTINAVEGFAGGETGYVKAGTLNVGNNVAASATTIEVGTMSGAYAVGGVVGGNSNNAPVFVFTANYEPLENSTIDIKIGDWKNTKDADLEAYFGAPDSDRQRAGTMSNVIGYLQGAGIEFIIGKDKDDNELLTVDDKMTAAKKIAVGYKSHRDENWNALSGAKYWGDTNGFVGYGKATYSINNIAVVSQAEDGFNLFKTDANYK